MRKKKRQKDSKGNETDYENCRVKRVDSRVRRVETLWGKKEKSKKRDMKN